ncbi:TraM recognition domain-containing protein [Dactylosporangium sp. NPDC050688]|uniref:type IV secretory system conjugative DNA transfer family protein n=1 Tax=Dactylosporangium sp. NPDC050688 TaxID=3157217 RepID=UPI00340DD466
MQFGNARVRWTAAESPHSRDGEVKSRLIVKSRRIFALLAPRWEFQDLLVLAAILLALVGVGVVCAVVWLPIWLTDPPGYHGGGPFQVVMSLASGEIQWTAACTVVVIAEGIVVAVPATWAAREWQRRRLGRTRVDAMAGSMASRKDLAKLSPAGVAVSGRRLRASLAGVDKPDPDQLGVLIGYTVKGGMPLRQSWEDMAIDIWGPRTGKTTARAIPAVVAAPGPTVVTSVKGDIVDATREVRATRGTVWIFDPQDILAGEQRLWWNPLGQIRTVTDARRLAEHFAAVEREPDVSRDAFFDPTSEELVANLLLAAAVGDRDILTAYRWAVNPRDDEPALLLRDHGFALPAESVSGMLNMPDKTRGGIFAGAQKMLMCLTEPAVARWVTPPADPALPEFDPVAFVTSTDTLYLLSQGGPGSPAPLVAAITHAVLHAGELRARTSANRRLDPPLLGVLDEAANICRLPQLPNLYSYYGSHGLSLITILQSYPQGVEVWGQEGMRKLWSAATVRTYGGGVADPDWLEELSKLIGEHDVTVRSTSLGDGLGLGTQNGWGDMQRSINHAPRRQRVLDVSDLHALPLGRMVVYHSGSPPVLARTAPWQTGRYADAIRASIARWDHAGHVSTEPLGDR